MIYTYINKILGVFLASMLLVNVDVFAQSIPVADQQLYDYFQSIPRDYTMKSQTMKGGAKSTSLRSQRPDHINNNATIYFPPLFNQSGGSCGSSANVAYMLCYEINTLKNQDGKHNTDYQFPSHFTWLTCSSSCSEQTMAERNGIPSVTDYGGQTYSKYFGLQDTEEKDVGWMQGYDKWYRAMYNRARTMGKFPYALDTEEGFELAKDWLWNHNGDGDFQTGGVFVIGVAAGPEYTLFPETPANKEAGVIGHHYVTTWGPKYNHALTVVGYDDRVEFDLDSNGVIGEKDKGEVGAWIIVNSWGNWCDAGSIYCPYAYTYCVGLSGSTWDPAFYHARKNYRPLRTIKLLMDYNRRPEILLGAGVSQDTTATEPDIKTSFAHFNYTGSAKTGDNAIPMLGRWSDGYHYEPMEFGYDLTDLTAHLDRTKPMKYFFYINTKYAASGTGNIYKASIIDYEFDRDGVEIPFKIDTVAILNRGKTTMISVIIPGEQTYKPLNLQLEDSELSWDAPQASALKMTGYAVYNNNNKIAELDANTLSYELNEEPSGEYSVSAVYEYDGQTNESEKSNSVRKNTSLPTSTNTVLKMVDTGVTIYNTIPKALDKATIEFWLKPYTVESYNQQLGVKWGTFLFHTTYSGQAVVGWNTDKERITSPTGTLTANKWSHVAITINSNVMTLYVDGVKKGSVTSNSYSGLVAIDNFFIGDPYYKFNGEIDEFRIWSSCRTLDEIKGNMNRQISRPASQPDLVTYLPMIKQTEDGKTSLVEYARGCNIDIDEFKPENLDIIEDGSILSGTTSVPTADFTMASETIFVGEPLDLKANISLDVTGIEWAMTGATTEQSTLNNPTAIYKTPGTYDITLTAHGANGDEVKKTKQIVVKAEELPNPDFDITNATVPAQENISFVNRTIGTGCTYTWSMPGANNETSNGTNALASYVETGQHAVTLTATNSVGSKSVTKYVTVTNAAPAVDFDITPSNAIVGDEVYMQDKTKYEPTKWLWNIYNSRHNIGVGGQSYPYKPQYPGVYNVSLTATNDVGTGSLTRNNALYVSNADPEYGLMFGGGGEQVSFNSPVAAATKAFTFDYWLYPINVEGALNISSEDGILNISTSATGETTITLNGKSVSSGENYVIAREWHHYAITYKAGTVIFYRDGEKFVQPSARLALSCPKWSGNIVLGSETTPFYGMIDEFCFWNKSLSISEIQATCNQPIADPEAMAKDAGLVIYYNFNQTTGNVNDGTGNSYTGTRTNFGPDGDAWSSSLGVFTLDFSAEEVETDVTADYLTNYKAPFIHSDERVNTTEYVSRFYKLETGTTQSGWKVENTTTEGTVTTGAYVDTYFNSALTCMTSDLGFADSVKNQRTYQTINLPAGLYRLDITPFANILYSDNSYMVANIGDALVGNDELDKALAYSQLVDGTLEFMLEEDSEVSLGFIFNIKKNHCVALQEIKLTKIPYEYYNADELTSITEANSNGNADVDFVVEKNGVRSLGTKPLQIANLQGVILNTAGCIPGTFVKLAPGIYIINGQKVSIK